MPVVFTSRFTPIAPSISGPPPPTGLAASPKTQFQINLTWNPVTSDPGGPGIKDYGIYRIGQGLLTYQTSTLYTDSGLTQGTTYTYYVTSRDLNLLESSQSAPASATTYVGPPVPTGLVAQVQSNTVIQIQWNASSDPGGPGIARYGVYFNGAKLGEVGSTSYIFTGLNPGTTYGFQVSSIDLNSIESAPCATVFGTTTGGAGLTIYHGQSITLTGSGFGAKSQTLFVHDYGQGTVNTLDPQWSGGWPNVCTAAQDNLQNQPLSFAPTGTALGSPDPFALQMMAGCHGAPGNNAAGGNNVNPWVTFTPPAFPYAIYARHWTRADPDWTFKLGSGEYNYKMYNFSVGNAPYGTVYWYWNFDPPAIGNNTTISQGVSNDVGGGLQNPDANGNSNYWPGNSSLPNHNYPLTLSPFNSSNGTGGWINQEFETKITNQTGSAASGGGYINWWNQFRQTVAYEGSTDTMSDPHRTFALEGYSVQYPLETNFRYLINCTVDISGPGAQHVARVYWTASATDADGANREVGITQPAGWTNTSINTQFWQGAFPTGTAVYPVILQENGTKTIGANAYTIVAPPPTFDYYISTTGSDSNAGTLASPWAITSFNSKGATYSGKRVGLMPGTYNVFSLAGLGRDTPALQINGGTSGHPTYVASCDASGNYSARTATITAKSGSTYGGTASPGAIISNNVNAATKGYVTLDGLRITGGCYLAIEWGTFNGSNVSTLNGYTVTNCEIFDFSAVGTPSGGNVSAITNNGTIGSVITNNKIHDYVSYTAGDAGHLSATIDWYSSGTVITNNTVTNAGSFFGKEHVDQGVLIAYNYNDMSGLTGSNGVIEDWSGAPDTTMTQPSSMHHNILICPTGIQLQPTLGAGRWVTNCSFYNNTVIAQSSNTVAGVAAYTGSRLFSIYNNIFYNNGGAASGYGYALMNIDSMTLVDYNMYSTARWTSVPSGATSSVSSTGYSTLASWQSAMSGSTGAEAHSAIANPTFTNAGALALQYTTTSGAAFNTGKVGGVPAGATCNMGAWDGTVTQIGCNF